MSNGRLNRVIQTDTATPLNGTPTTTTHTVTMTYEAGCDRVRKVQETLTGANGYDHTVEYAYTVEGLRKTMTLPGSAIPWTYTYTDVDANGMPSTPDPGDTTLQLPALEPDKISHRLTGITDDAGKHLSYTFDHYGRMQSARSNLVTTGNGGSVSSYQETTYSYDLPLPSDLPNFGNGHDTHGWLQKVSTTWHGPRQGNPNNEQISCLLSETEYGYDLHSGQRTSATRRWQNTDANGYPQATASRVETYGYDEQYRLAAVDYGDTTHQGTPNADGTVSAGNAGYTFDAMGNRLTRLDNGTPGNQTCTYDAAGLMLTGVNGQAYTNDRDGNTLSDGTRTNTWDSQNRLTHCVKAAVGSNPAVTTGFFYGTDGLRRQKVAVTGSTTVVTNSLLDNGMLVRETNGSGSTLATYLVGARGPECRRDNVTGLVRWYVFDGLGSVVGEVDPNGNLTAARTLDVYGAERGSGGASTASSKQGFVGSLGHTTDAETGGLVYMRARYMDTATGRFVSEDPSCDGINWFVYCDNNPVNMTDSNGLFIDTILNLLPFLSHCSVCERANFDLPVFFGWHGFKKTMVSQFLILTAIR